MQKLQIMLVKTGRGVSWLVLAMVLLMFFVVVQRYIFNAGSIALQESVTYLHAMVFMLAAAWTLSEDGHVRVDIFYRDASPRRKAWVNLLGSLLFLLPFALFILFGSWGYVAASWAVFEGSREAGGLPLVWLLKSLIPIFALLLLTQGLLLVLNSYRFIRQSSIE